MNKTIFVYGTLLKGLSRNSVLKDSEFLGLAYCQGNLINLGSFPGLITGEDNVIGELYKLSDNKILEILDQIEGFNKDDKSASMYLRENMRVRLLSSGEWVEAQSYIFNHSSDDYQTITNGDYRLFLSDNRANDFVHYIAYGSNLSISRMKNRIGNWRQALSGTLPGYRLVYNKQPANTEKYAYANLTVGANGRDCPAVAYEIKRTLLEKLDICEGCPDHYIRTVMPVKTLSGREVMGYVYVANPEKLVFGKKASAKYRRHLLTGYKDLNLGFLDDHEFCLD